MAHLLKREIEQYHAEGWVIPGFRLPALRVEQLREALDALIRNKLRCSNATCNPPTGKRAWR